MNREHSKVVKLIVIALAVEIRSFCVYENHGICFTLLLHLVLSMGFPTVYNLEFKV